MAGEFLSSECIRFSTDGNNSLLKHTPISQLCELYDSRGQSVCHTARLCIFFTDLTSSCKQRKEGPSFSLVQMIKSIWLRAGRPRDRSLSPAHTAFKTISTRNGPFSDVKWPASEAGHSSRTSAEATQTRIYTSTTHTSRRSA
jgi:hypothetical protein